MPFIFTAPPLPAWIAKAAPTPSQLRALHTIANRMEPEFARNFLVAMRDLQDDVDWDQFVSAVQRGDTGKVQTILNNLPTESRLVGAVDTMRRTFHAGGALATSQARGALDGVSFTLTNPSAIQWAETNSARLVTQVSEETRTMLQRLAARLLRGDATVADTARAIRPLIGLTERDAQAVVNYRAGLAQSGVAPIKIEAAAQRYATRLLRSRAKTIARTEVLNAASAGQQAIWQEAIDTGVVAHADVEQKWITSAGACPKVCEPMNGQTAPLGGLFQTGDGRLIPRPTAHPNCRCGIVLQEKRTA